MSEPKPKPALHNTTLGMLGKCGVMAELRYVYGLKVPPGVAQIVGIALHQTAADDLRAKMKTGALLAESDVLDLAGDAFDALWEGEGVQLDDEDRRRGRRIVRGEAKDEVVALQRVHHRTHARRLKPVAVERSLRAELVGFPFDIEGTIDVVNDVGSQPGELVDLHDLKSMGKAPAGDEADKSPQLEEYALLHAINGGAPVRYVAHDVVVKAAKPYAARVTAPAPRSFEVIKQRIERAARVFETGAFYPVDASSPSGWVCCEKFCGYWRDHCPFGRRARRTFAAPKPPEGTEEQ